MYSKVRCSSWCTGVSLESELMFQAVLTALHSTGHAQCKIGVLCVLNQSYSEVPWCNMDVCFQKHLKVIIYLILNSIFVSVYIGTLLFPIMVVNTFNLRALEAEGGDLWIQGQPALHIDFKISRGYTLRLCLQNRETEREEILPYVSDSPILSLDPLQCKEPSFN